eukprot:CAMPEP_0119004644 /NCGR_PEP_ID=MMETSP1176-20130426/1268_1 /TAXON_ID=265551 /ORGANISM="Synedropsis recta cf, Strain CCMP1620" /LENGTH=348 /DNA_ID=CAMNT_0006956379 /DNA_START=24 /DNA_END=1070 /DNA_ORIENTATION=-
MMSKTTAALFVALGSTLCAMGRLTEDVRQAEYHKRGYTWPPSLYSPDTEGWARLSNRRFDQAPFVLTRKEKYDLWMQSVTSAIVQPNFTETGWGLARAPEDLVGTLRATVREAYDAGDYRNEHHVDVIDGLQPIFIDRPALTARVLKELHPMHEAWAGVPLTPAMAYGYRLYRNESSLLMHVDKSDTHVISAILHIDSSDDAEPWPIVLEDFLGNTNEVVLTPGDMLFYESSKCFHGRPAKFVGSWYSSVFVHFYPSDPAWTEIDHHLEGHYAIPISWNEPPGWKRNLPEVEVRGTSLREPECLDNWCGLEHAVRWHGPAELDYVITSGVNGPTKYPLWEDDEEEDEF